MLTLNELAAVGSIAVSLLVILKPVRTRITKIWKKIFTSKTRLLLENHILSEETQLNRIEAELHSNGGSSLKDYINDIKHAVRRVEEKQAEFDAFLKAQLNIHHTAVFRANVSGKWTYANRQHQRLTGFSFPEVAGDGWINIIHPSDRSRVHDAWEEAVSGGREFSEDIRYITPSGEEYIVHVNVYRELDEESRVRGYLGVVTPKQYPKGVFNVEIQER